MAESDGPDAAAAAECTFAPIERACSEFAVTDVDAAKQSDTNASPLGLAAPTKGETDPGVEISVLTSKGLPAESIVSIRLGGMRRQRRLKECKEPFVFCTPQGMLGSLQVDVLVPMATSGSLGQVSPGEYTFDLRPYNGCASSKSFGDGGDTANMSLRVSGTPHTPVEKTDGDRVQNYIEAHGLMEKLHNAMKDLFVELPADPCRFLADLLHRDAEPLPAEQSLPVAPLRRPREESLHVVPSCASLSGSTRFLDLGSGETGFYVYSMVEGEKLIVASEKRSKPFFSSFVEPGDVDGFCQAIVEAFGLISDCPDELTIFCGATGIHRELLMDNPNARTQAWEFLRNSELALSAKLRSGPLVSMWLFVPSGMLESQLEFQATEWLLGRTTLFDLSSSDGSKEAGQGDHIIRQVFDSLDRDGEGHVNPAELKKCRPEMRTNLFNTLPQSSSEGQIDFDQFKVSICSSVILQMMAQTSAFSGTLSAGGGSSQLAVAGGMSGSIQHFSIACGSRIPLVQKMFSNPVLPEEQEAWRGRIRAELREASVPRGARGLFIGISATYHAMKFAGLSDRIINKATALEGLAAKLSQVQADDQRNIANLILLQELLQWCFDDSACFTFKRNWRVDDEVFVSTWTLGLFTQQYAALKQKDKTCARSKWQFLKQRIKNPISTTSIMAKGNLPSLFDVPFVAWPFSPSHLLDFGAGEIGFYTYEADVSSRLIGTLLAEKVEKPLYDGFVAPSLAVDFAEVLIAQFGLQPSEFASAENMLGRSLKREIFVGGATGFHRDICLRDQGKRNEILRFVCNVEQEVTRRIHRPAVFRIFVPSCEMEAQFELRAIEWLVRQPDTDINGGAMPDWVIDQAYKYLAAVEGEKRHSLPKVDVMCAQDKLHSLGVDSKAVMGALKRADSDVDQGISREEFFHAVRHEPALETLVRRCTFSGSISGGGSGVTITCCSVGATSQIFSMRIGALLPISEHLFSSPVTWREQRLWVEKIRSELRSCHFPQGECGLFVAVGATYYAARVAGLSDRVVEKQQAIAGLASAIAKLDCTDRREVANLTLVKELIDWVFDDFRSAILFKRTWHTGGTTHIAGWTLGWYISQFMEDQTVREQCVRQLQSLVRGRRVRRMMMAKSKSRSPAEEDYSGDG